MKLKNIVTFVSKFVIPQSGTTYNLYSLPSFDENKSVEVLDGAEIQSNKYDVPNKCILFNKLNVRFKRVWRINNSDSNKIASTEFLPLVVNEDVVDYQYCYYLLISDEITNYLCGQNSNTSGSHKRIDPRNFLNIDIHLPKMPIQKAIGKTLSDIDRKIELNKRINDNLEAMAKQLYDYWFVQFDFPNEEGKPYKSSGGAMVWNEYLKREIPKDWEVEPLNNWLDIKSGFAFKSETYQREGKYKIITIKNVQNHHLETNGCDCISILPEGTKAWCKLKIDDRLISLTGNCGRLCIVTEDNLLFDSIGESVPL